MGIIEHYGLKVVEAVEAVIVEAFRQLLEEKHLYQRKDIGPLLQTNLEHWIANSQLPPNDELRKHATATLCGAWSIADPSKVRPRVRIHPYDASEIFGISNLPNAKLYCHQCKSTEAHQPIGIHEFIPLDKIMNKLYQQPLGDAIQIWAFQYQCQLCKDLPIVFLIRRENSHISIQGRTPMEFVTTPQFIPKEERAFYSGAIIANNSGQVLPAIFMLRVFIEQYCKRKANKSVERSSDAIAIYMDSLPQDFKSRFPSLNKIYEVLSVTIHNATPTESVFTDSLSEVDLHLEGLQVWEKTNRG